MSCEFQHRGKGIGTQDRLPTFFAGALSCQDAHDQRDANATFNTSQPFPDRSRAKLPGWPFFPKCAETTDVRREDDVRTSSVQFLNGGCNLTPLSLDRRDL